MPTEAGRLIAASRNSRVSQSYDNLSAQHNYGSINDDSLGSYLTSANRSRSEVQLAAENVRQRRQAASAAAKPHKKDHVEALSERYEGLNYEVVESTLQLNELNSPEFNKLLLKKVFNRWVVCFLTGLGTGCVGFFIYINLKYIEKWKFDTLETSFHKCIGWDASECTYQPLLIWLAINVVFSSLSAGLVLFVAGPVAAGSGIPQIKCFLNGIKIPKVVSFKALISKAVGVLCSVAGGLTVGREGPMIHSGACVAATIAKGRISKPCAIDCKCFEYYRTDTELRDFVSVGAASGVAAAFGAPIGGVLFSLEEGASFWNQALTWRMFFGAMTCAFFLNFFKSLANGRGRDLSWVGLVDFGTFTNLSEFNTWEIVVYVIIGIIGGVLGALFNHLNYKLTLFRMDYIRSKRHKFIEVLIVCMATAAICFVTCYTMGDCVDNHYERQGGDADDPDDDEKRDRPIQMFCQDGQHNTLASLFLRSPEDATSAMFHQPVDAYGVLTLGVFCVEMFLLSCWTYGLSVASGLFIPSLLTGAAWGRLIAVLMRKLIPAMVCDVGKYALAGAAAQLAGNTRMTISLCVILIEATRDITFGLPLMIILMLAKWVGDYFNEGIYDIHINLNEVPLLGWEPPFLSEKISATKVIAKPVTVLREVERVDRVYDLLMLTKHHAFPVVDLYDPEAEDPFGLEPTTFGRYCGMILRSQLIVLLQNKAFVPTQNGYKEPEGHYASLARHKPLKMADFRKKYPKYDKELQNLVLTPIERKSWIDLRYYMNKAPYSVSVDVSLSKMYHLFRGLGLRHIVVVDRNNLIVGIVSRRDIARFKAERIAGKIVVKELPISSDNIQ